MAETWFGFDLDEDFEQLWHILEAVQDGDRGHHIAIKASSKAEAARIITTRLASFFEQKCYPSDEHGDTLADE